MKRFIVEQSDEELYTSHSGLALVGLCINRYSGLSQHPSTMLNRRASLEQARKVHASYDKDEYQGETCFNQ